MHKDPGHHARQVAVESSSYSNSPSSGNFAARCPVDIREIQASEIELARALLSQNGWSHRVADPERFRELIARSQRAFVAVEDGKVIGFARALCDDLSNGYLSMVVVDSNYRRRGIGRALVQAVMGTNPAVTWVLRAGRPEEVPFFEKLGFTASTIAMERMRS